MHQNYFVYNGETYYSGATITMYHVICDGVMNKQIKKATFLFYDTECKKFVYSIDDKKYFVNASEFYNKIINVYSNDNNNFDSCGVKQMKESKIDSLFIGWIAYIVAMLFATMCDSRILLYTIISFVFFNYRRSKLKTEGYYYEWQT